MSGEPAVIEGPYLRDVLDQPRALADTIAGLGDSGPLHEVATRLAAGGYRRVVLTGMGSSCHALAPLHLRLVAAGHSVATVETSELLYYQEPLLGDGSLLVVLSQSGRSAETVRVLEAVRGRRVDVVGVTNTEDSPLARDAAAVVLTRAGLEATVSCKTYLAAQAALSFLADRLERPEGFDAAAARNALGAAPTAAAEYLSAWRDHVAWLVPALRGVRATYYAGRGPSLAAALTAGLITKESTHRPAEGMSGAAFRHGPMELVDGDVFLLVFAGEPRTRRLNEALVADVRAAGARAWLAAEDAREPVFRLPALPDGLRPLLELLPVEMVTLAFAAIDGREAGRFERTAKVTTTE